MKKRIMLSAAAALLCAVMLAACGGNKAVKAYWISVTSCCDTAITQENVPYTVERTAFLKDGLVRNIVSGSYTPREKTWEQTTVMKGTLRRPELAVQQKFDGKTGLQRTLEYDSHGKPVEPEPEWAEADWLKDRPAGLRLLVPDELFRPRDFLECRLSDDAETGNVVYNFYLSSKSFQRYNRIFAEEYESLCALDSFTGQSPDESEAKSEPQPEKKESPLVLHDGALYVTKAPNGDVLKISLQYTLYRDNEWAGGYEETLELSR